MAQRDEPRWRRRTGAAGAVAFLVAVIGGWGSLPAAAGAYSLRSSGVTHHRSQESEETLQLIIGDGGFEPAEVMRRAGKFLLTADDCRTDKSQGLRLWLSREGGEQLREIEVPMAATDWAEELDLPAGRYVLAEASHPAWSCSIVVE